MDIETEQINQIDSDGFQHGLWKHWYANGQLMHEENYVNGLRNGLRRDWHSNGQLWFIVNFVNGVIEGEEVEYGY